MGQEVGDRGYHRPRRSPPTTPIPLPTPNNPLLPPHTLTDRRLNSLNFPECLARLPGRFLQSDKPLSLLLPSSHFYPNPNFPLLPPYLLFTSLFLLDRFSFSPSFTGLPQNAIRVQYSFSLFIFVFYTNIYQTLPVHSPYSFFFFFCSNISDVFSSLFLFFTQIYQTLPPLFPFHFLFTQAYQSFSKPFFYSYT